MSMLFVLYVDAFLSVLLK